MTQKSENVVWHGSSVSTLHREALLDQKGCVVWFTGLSGSGKSTVAHAVEKALIDAGHLAYVLDGDNIRHGLNGNLGFSDADREENIRRVAEVARLFADCGVICLASFISPFRASRRMVRDRAGEGRFIEVFVDAPLTVCEERDPKGLYQRVRSGEISEFTGIDSPYEEPENPELVLNTAEQSIVECTDEVIDFLKKRKFLSHE